MQLRYIFQKATVAGMVAIAFLLVAACGLLQDGDRVRAPNYASPTAGMGGWQVSCGRDKIFIDDGALDEFYSRDGRLKTYTEFCEALGASSNKLRRWPDLNQ